MKGFTFTRILLTNIAAIARITELEYEVERLESRIGRLELEKRCLEAEKKALERENALLSLNKYNPISK